MPSLRLDLSHPCGDIRSQFPAPVSDVWLEIGFGSGEHLLWQAAAHPTVGLIGVEPFINGLAKAIAGIEATGSRNFRLFDDDVRELLPWLPTASLGRVFVLYPDPWPKTRHHKRRLLNAETFAELARIMRPGAQLRIATDVGDYARAILLTSRSTSDFQWEARCASDWRARPPDWPQTRYEAKAEKAGRRCIYLTFERCAHAESR